MARIYYRPTTAVDYGDVQTSGAGNVLGDNNDSTGKWYMETSGSVMVYPNFNEALIPSGKKMLSVRVGHRQTNGGTFNLFNGWIASYLRQNNTRVPSSYAYKQDGTQNGVRRQVMGPPIYKTGQVPWTYADINTMSSDHGSAVGSIGPNANNFWCGVTEGFIIITTDEPVPVPTIFYPANNATISTSSVNFSANSPALQEEQPVRAVFQVARDSNFTDDVRTFGGKLVQSEAAGSKSEYVSKKTEDSYTNLGPGKWFLRVKGRDYLGAESAWGVTTSFTISHPALPVPVLVAPAPGQTAPNPLAIRSAYIPEIPSGDRKAGVEWQFSKVNTFDSGVIAWSNRNGTFVPAQVGYDPTPRSEVKAGQNGAYVSTDDPDQRLTQGLWYVRVRAVDPWGQTGAWSETYGIAVSHPPVVAAHMPDMGAAFDPVENSISWKFTDPWNGDIQTAYQVVAWDNSDNLLFDTGKVTSSVPAAKVTIPANQLRKVIKYLVAVWDIDDIQSQSAVIHTFLMTKSPVTTITSPQDQESIASGQPVATWTNVFAAAGITQKSFRLRYLRADTATLVYDSGVITGAQLSFQPPYPILQNKVGYQLQLTVTDSENASKTVTRLFFTNFQRPAGTLTYAESDGYGELGYVRVDWDGDVDPFFAYWRIYRKKKDEPDSAYVLAGTVEQQDVLTFKDWMVAGTGYYQYSVVQVAYRFGSLVESDFEQYPVDVYITGSSYWLISPDDEQFNMKLYSVVGDKYTGKKQTNSYVILGGGMRMNQGPRIGKEGTLSCQIRANENKTATQQLQDLDELDLKKGWVIMRDPYGNTTKISIGEVSLTRIPGVGTQEFADIEIPYYEVR